MTWTAPALGEQRESDMLQMRCLDHGDAVIPMHAGGSVGDLISEVRRISIRGDSIFQGFFLT